MTRAMERLYLIRAKARTMYGHYGLTIESRFLREIDKDCLIGVEKLGSDTTDFIHAPMGANDGFASTEIFRPFDSLDRMKKEVARTKDVLVRYEAGDRVSHNKFGGGVVIEMDGDVVTVMFDSVGRKKLAANIAPLERL
jgi:DNA helicase-2/ATP-dependent DNA helicase PcrA